MTFYHSEVTVKHHIEKAMKLVLQINDPHLIKTVESAISAAKDKSIPIEQRMNLIKDVISKVVVKDVV